VVRTGNATAGDLADLAALPLDIPDWADLLTDPTVVVLTLRVGEQLVGAALGRLNTAGHGEVEAVYVAPPWRRRYWGSALADELQAQLQGQGAREIRATAERSDRTATAFWANLGWEPARQIFAARARMAITAGEQEHAVPGAAVAK